MLKIGSFISSVFKKNQQVLIYAYQNNHQKKLDFARKFAKQNNKTQINLIFNFQGNYRIENLDEIIQKKPANLHIKFHPSNRKIEIHLLLLQFLTKNSHHDYYCLITTPQPEHHQKLIGIKHQYFKQQPALFIKTKLLMKHYLSHTNELRSINSLVNS